MRKKNRWKTLTIDAKKKVKLSLSKETLTVTIAQKIILRTLIDNVTKLMRCAIIKTRVF